MMELFFIGAVMVVLLIVGAVQTIRFFISLIVGPARQREQERLEAMRTSLDLRRLRDRGYITPEVFEQVAKAYADWQRGVPPLVKQAPDPQSTADAQPATTAGRPPAKRLTPPVTVIRPPAARPVVPPPLPPRQTPAAPSVAPARPALFASFLERRNIRWGELLGGLLILGCSTALVVSFWAQIADRPMFKFGLFTCATAAFFAAGLYSEHRWKLPTTSRAILLLATLLVPVNLLAIAALGSSGRAKTSTLIAQLASLAIFTAFTWPAARVLVGKSARLLTAGLSATSLALVALTARPALGPAPLAAMPTACLLVCSGIVIVRLWKLQANEWGEAISGYLLLGVIGFAAWLAVGFVLFTAPSLADATTSLAPIFTALGLPAYFLGLVVWKRATAPSDEAPHADAGLGSQATPFDKRITISGLSVAIFGVAILLAGIVAAWPGAMWLVTTGACDALLLAATAIVFDLPGAYVPAAILASLAWVVGCHTWPMSAVNDPQAILAGLQSGENGWLLLPMAMVLGLASRAAARRPRHGLTLGILALFIAAVSLVLANSAVALQTIETPLDPACFDLLMGTGFFLLWATASRWRWWNVLGTALPLLLAELLILSWTGQSTDALIERMLPAMPIVLCAIVPMALGLIAWQAKRSISPGTLGGAALLETVGIALVFRWNRPGDFGDAALIVRCGHVVSAWAVFGLGVLLRWRFDVPVADGKAGGHGEQARRLNEEGSATVLAYRAEGVHRRWRLRSLLAVGIVEQTVRWTVLTGVLAFIGCLITDIRLMSEASGMLALSMLAGCLACWADLPGLLFAAGVLLNFAGTFALMMPAQRWVNTDQLPAANAVFLAIGGGIALLLDRQLFSRRGSVDGREVAFHLWASWASLFLLATIWILRSTRIWTGGAGLDWVMWTAMLSVTALFAARLIEPRVRDPIAGIYLSGIVAVAFALEYVRWGWAPPGMVWGMALGLYGLVTATAGMWIARLLQRNDPRRRFLLDWLRFCTVVLAALAMWGSAYGDWSDAGQRVRIAAAIVALAQGLALGLLAEEEVGMQVGALAATAMGMVLIAWAAMPAWYLAHWLVAISAAAGAMAAFAVLADGASQAVGGRWRRAIDAVVTVVVGAIAVGTAAVVIGVSSAYILDPALTLASLGPIRVAQLPAINVIFLVIAGGAGVWLDRKGGRGVKVIAWASWSALLLLAANWTVQSLGIFAVRGRPDWLMWTALAAVAAMFADRLEEPTACDPIAGMYFIGLLASGYAMAYVPTAWAARPVVWSIALGVYGIAVAAMGAAAARAMPAAHRRRTFLLHWLRISSAATGVCALCGAMYCNWSEPGWRVRMLAAAVACAQGLGLAVVAEEDAPTQSAALAAIAAGMVAIAWAAMPIGYMVRRLDVASAAVVALSAFTAASAGVRKFASRSWRSTIRSTLNVAICVAGAATVAVVVGEATDWMTGSAPLISTWAVIGIECGLLVALAAAVARALGKTAAAVAERSACVWAAEGLALLAFVHLRVAEPWMFSHRVEQYWPMVLMALAFAGLSGGFAWNRRGRGEIGRPLVYTGLALPAAAILGYWLHPSIVDYSAVLWTAGLLYGIVAAVRRSPGVTLVSAACVNGALWVVWGRHAQTQFFVHPQLWIVPAALSVLAAAQIHHRQLSPAQMRRVRYLCLAVIYLSSTADIVLGGMAATPWLPMVLAGLAIVGVLAGIQWRIRPFLYLGMTFLLIAVLMMIWTAQVNLHWTWLWYVAGLAAGVTLFTLFGLFEKRHEQMARLLEGLKQWQ